MTTGCSPSLVAAACLLISSSVLAAELDEQATEEAKEWSVLTSLGLTLTDGNSDTFLATATFEAERDREKDELRFRAAAGYGEDDTNGTRIKTQDFLRGSGQYNSLFTPRLYGGLKVEALRDDISDVDYRVITSPLMGYYFLKDERTQLAGEVGPSYVLERRGGVEDDYFGVRISERFEHEFDSDARVWQSLEVLPQVDEFDNYVLEAEFGVSTKVTNSVGMRLVVQDTYVSEPAPDRENNDVKLIAGFEYRF